ncbi:MAG: site-specific DNA-methyltransferase [Candidatus Poribacteria bacterium]|nr:site-specific DNA-methyltransferase [Candidatus Poribacteria bacterium]
MKPALEYEIHLGDSLEWIRTAKPNSVHAIVTDPPFGLVEYSTEHLEKRRNGNGGIWRLPRNHNGNTRQPVPRFTVLTKTQHSNIGTFFERLGRELYKVIVPGGHMFLASNPLVAHLIDIALIQSGFEKRGQIVRIVQTLRGGDRPKNAHTEFPDVSVLPRGVWEPWLLFRKPCEGRVQDNLRKWKTGGLRRPSTDVPFKDLIHSAPARRRERIIAPHPSLKPQAFVRQLVRASLPLGQGVLLDPFMGSGAVIAAASRLGIYSIGIENNEEYYNMAMEAIPQLAALETQ